ncbi:MAG: Arm DNA-binding domain-containing protein [Methylococcaceae bacterium]|nr:Arm DNA-binding domain-containing protein [Methylococcaceae bacterium]
MALSDTTIKNAKPNPDKAYKLPDEKGMYLLINPNGSKYFRYKYRFAGKEKALALGVYPETSLKKAREKRDDARKLLADGIDPGENRKAVMSSKAESDANSFEVIAREWGLKKVETWADKNNRSKRMLERNILPWLGSKPITDLLPKDILDCLRRIEDRGTIETAHRTEMVN